MPRSNEVIRGVAVPVERAPGRSAAAGAPARVRRRRTGIPRTARRSSTDSPTTRGLSSTSGVADAVGRAYHRRRPADAPSCGAASPTPLLNACSASTRSSVCSSRSTTSRAAPPRPRQVEPARAGRRRAPAPPRWTMPPASRIRSHWAGPGAADRAGSAGCGAEPPLQPVAGVQRRRVGGPVEPTRSPSASRAHRRPQRRRLRRQRGLDAPDRGSRPAGSPAGRRAGGSAGGRRAGTSGPHLSSPTV